MKIGIIGAGAMGCLYACLLSEKTTSHFLTSHRMS